MAAAEEIAHEPHAKRQRQLSCEETAVYLVEIGWSLLDSPRDLEIGVQTEPALLKYERTLVPEAKISTMLRFLPPLLWQLLVFIVNRSLTATNIRSCRRKPTTPGELLRFYSIQLVIENTFGNDTKTLEKHFKCIKSNGHTVKGLGCDRFLLIKKFINSNKRRVFNHLSSDF